MLTKQTNRQRLVNLIVFFWRVMPMRAKVWAFLNDEELHDVELHNSVEPDTYDDYDHDNARDDKSHWF